MRTTKKLTHLIQSPQLEFLIEAHNGLSARIAEEAGFRGIWASGLSMSAQWGVRDNNEASWSQVVDHVEFMADAVKIPILLDGDTGYGNFNSMRRLVRKLEQRGVGGVCIEDKLFPKTNSFINGVKQQLADADEFAGKIKAGKDAQSDADFVIVARVEALIAGLGMAEALRRAEIYRLAGADAILIHSAQRTADEVITFKKEWGDRLPVIIVPTKYYTTPTEVFRDSGFSTVIWANHLMRSSVAAMQNTAAQLFRDQNLFAIESEIAPVQEIFRLQGEHELEAAEAKYLPARDSGTVIILAASRGQELGDLTADKPKCMVSIAGIPLLERITAVYRSAGYRQIHVVTGYCHDRVNLPGLEYHKNAEFASTGEVYSLWQAAAALSGEVVISYGDVLFRKYLLDELTNESHDIGIVVDSRAQVTAANRSIDRVWCSEPHTRHSFYRHIKLNRISFGAADVPADGEWAGILRLTTEGSRRVKQCLLEWSSEADFRKASIPDLLNRLVGQGNAIAVQYTRGHWIDVDTIEDVIAAGELP